MSEAEESIPEGGGGAYRASSVWKRSRRRAAGGEEEGPSGKSLRADLEDEASDLERGRAKRRKKSEAPPPPRTKPGAGINPDTMQDVGEFSDGPRRVAISGEDIMKEYTRDGELRCPLCRLGFLVDMGRGKRRKEDEMQEFMRRMVVQLLDKVPFEYLVTAVTNFFNIIARPGYEKADAWTLEQVKPHLEVHYQSYVLNAQRRLQLLNAMLWKMTGTVFKHNGDAGTSMNDKNAKMVLDYAKSIETLEAKRDTARRAGR